MELNDKQALLCSVKLGPIQCEWQTCATTSIDYIRLILL